jgi:hypothetical protein
MIGGVKIITNSLLSRREQFRRTWHHKARIRKKWRKDQRNYRDVPDEKFYQINHDTFVAHPITASRFIAHINQEPQNDQRK